MFVTVNFLRVNSCVVTRIPLGGLLQKKEVNPGFVRRPEIKYVNYVSCVDHLSSVKEGHKCPNICSRSTCLGQIAPIWANW